MKQIIAQILCVVFLFNSLPFAAHAAVVSTQQATLAERAEIMNLIKREDVRAEFSSYGLTAQEMEMKLAAMSDQEIIYLHEQLGELPAGQGAIGAIVGAALVVFIILLVTDLLGLTHVFGFVSR